MNRDEMPRVLIIVSNLSIKSGVTTVMMNYIRESCGNILFSVVYFDKTEESTFYQEMIDLGINVYYLPRKTFVDSWRSFCNKHFGEFDILHNNQPFISFALIGVKRKLGVKAVITHAHTTKHSDSFLKSIRNCFLSLPSLRSDWFFACSRDAGNALFGRRFRSRGTVLHNSVFLEHFIFDPEQRKHSRSAFNIESKIVIGHVGNFTPQKNHKFLVKVFAELVKENPNYHLLLVGEGYLRKEIEACVLKMGIADNVSFLGVRNDIGYVMSAMDVFVLPSVFEGLGIVLIEAQANGLRCVYSDVVPREADVNPTYNKSISLKKGPDLWAKAIGEMGTSRIDNVENLKNAGYDIHRQGAELASLYAKIVSKEKHEKES